MKKLLIPAALVFAMASAPGYTGDGGGEVEVEVVESALAAALPAAKKESGAAPSGPAEEARASAPVETVRPTPRPGAGDPRSDIENEKEIRSLYDEFMAAWNRHDAKAMAKHWTIDGDHFEPDGTRAHGKHEVEKLFTLEQATVFKVSEIDLVIETVFFISQDVALVDGSYEVVGAKTQGGDALPARQGHLTSVLLKERGEWWVVASRATINVPLAWRGD